MNIFVKRIHVPLRENALAARLRERYFQRKRLNIMKQILSCLHFSNLSIR